MSATSRSGTGAGAAARDRSHHLDLAGVVALGYFLVLSTVAPAIGIVPTTLVSALTPGEVPQTLLVALLVGFAVQGTGARGVR
jgi:hypothetical protein